MTENVLPVQSTNRYLGRANDLRAVLMVAPFGHSQSRHVAILSDVHINVVALRAVLAELDDLAIDEIVVAGALVGFGPNPEDVVDLLVERRAQLIRGNHEKDYVAPYAKVPRPDTSRTDSRLHSMIWLLDRLGPERRTFLSELPDSLLLDSATLVVQGSPRHVRDSVLPWTSEAELNAMFDGSLSRLVFMGHTHHPVIRDTTRRRLVNAGSVGLPLDDDPRASYVLARQPHGALSDWEVDVRRVPYDVEAAVAAYDNGLKDVDGRFVEIMSRQLRAARDYFGPWLRVSNKVPATDLPLALKHFLASDP